MPNAPADLGPQLANIRSFWLGYGVKTGPTATWCCTAAGSGRRAEQGAALTATRPGRCGEAARRLAVLADLGRAGQ
jgi:hypothetical protein